ncbi:MAG: TldD/PmbA family protein [Candidatus Bathyarchaeota archaeon]|nr:MAG: TldD/PmbA family protein [Candidatus Bathyarchaeota archaeon]
MATKRLQNVSEKTVELALKEKADQAQAASFMWDSALTRFANSQIHQNVASKAGGVALKIVIDKRIGTLTVNTLEENRIKETIKQAVKIAKITPPNREFTGLPKPEKWAPIQGAFDKDTANCSPDYRADIVGEAIDTAHSKSPIVKAVAGSFSTEMLAFAVSNSLGVSAWAKISLASINTTVISELDGSEGFGYAEQSSRNVKDIRPAQIADRAAEKSISSVKPKKLSPGEYETVLSPLAVGTIFNYLGYIGFSATPFQDGQSFVKYHLKEQVFDRKVSVKDDARDEHSLIAVPVDGEGVPKKAVKLVDAGVVSERSICYDSLTGGREKGKRSTGHSFPPITSGFGQARPMPINVVAAPGDAAIEEMIKETGRGIFVTRFHYVNPVDPTKAILTGLTRDGTFLIEKGEIVGPIVNMRFTDSMLSALKRVPMIGKELEQGETATVPAIKLEKLRFTGVTQH